MAYHIGPIDSTGHFDLPIMLPPTCQWMGTSDGSCTTTIVWMEVCFSSIIANHHIVRFFLVIPYPRKICQLCKKIWLLVSEAKAVKGNRFPRLTINQPFFLSFPLHYLHTFDQSFNNV